MIFYPSSCLHYFTNQKYYILEQSAYHINDDLLIRYLLKECSPEEVLAIERWIAADEANAKQFAQFEWIWQQSKRVAATSNIDTGQAWNHFKELRDGKLKPVAKPVPIRNNRRWWMQAAAAVLIMALFALGIRLMLNSPEVLPMLAINTTETPLTDTLADGSMVTLNKNSSLQRPEGFTGKERRVVLTGEAFFEVQPDKEKPFTITSGQVEITVLGTSFNVKTIGSTLEVIVETGQVKVAFAGKTTLVNASEKMLLNMADTTFELKTNSEKLHQYYRTRVFVCDNTTLQDLVTVLSEAYNTPISIERNDWKNLRLSATFNNESLESILEIVAATLEISTTQNGDVIIFK